MLSLATGKLVNRDQFFILPMPELLIKRLNELALADGRVKGKGDLAKPTVTFEQDGVLRNGVPETIVTEVNNGVDPSVSLMDAIDYQELIYCVTLESQEEGSLKAKRSWLVRVESRRYASNFCKAAQTS